MFKADGLGEHIIHKVFGGHCHEYNFDNNNDYGAEIRVKGCKVSDKNGGKQVEFMSQYSGEGSQDLYAFHTKGEYSKLNPPKPDVLMKDAGCVTTSLAMMFDFFGFNQLNNNLNYAYDYQNNKLNYTPINPGTMNILFREVDDLRTSRSTFIGPPSKIKTYDDNNDVTYHKAAEAIRGSEQLKCYSSAQSQPNFATNKDFYINNCIQSSKSKISYIGPEKGGRKVFNVNSKGYLKPYISAEDKAERLAEEKLYYKDIEKEICAGNPVLLRVARDPKKDDDGNDKPVDGHTVLVTESLYENQGTAEKPDYQLTFRTNNPGRGGPDDGEGVKIDDLKKDSVKYKGYKYTIGYDIFRPEADPSMILVKSSDNMHFVLTDNLGRRAGFDPTAQTEYKEIPNAVYSYIGIEPNDEDGTSVDPETMPHSRQLFLSDNVQSGDYQIKTFSLSDGPGFLLIIKTDVDGFTNDEESHKINVVAGEQKIMNFKHSIDPLPIVNSELAVNFFRFESDNTKIYGELKSENGLNLTCDSQIKINIGGPSDYLLNLALSNFLKKVMNGLTFYELKTPDYKITLSASGMFWIELYGFDFENINQANKGKISISMNNYFGRKNLMVTCNNNICNGD